MNIGTPRLLRATRVAGSFSRPAVLAITAVLALCSPGLHAQVADGGRLELTTASDAARQHFWMGMNDQLNVYPSGAARHFQMAVDADPEFGLAKVLHAFVAPAPTAAARSDALSEAMRSVTGASTHEILLATAMREWGSGGAPTASRLMLVLSEMLPNDPHIATHARQLARARGDDTDVILGWEGLIARFPDFAPPYNSLAYAQWRVGDRGEAMANVAKYMELAPDHPNAHDSYAEMHSYDGSYSTALAHYQRAAELEPAYDQAYVGMAEVYSLVGALDAAVEQMNLAYEHRRSPPNGVTTLRQLASMQALHGDRDGAMGTLGRAAAAANEAGIANMEAVSHLQMALTDALLNEGRAAQAHLDRAADIGRPDAPDQLIATGLVQASTGRAQAAKETATKLAEGNTNPAFQSLAKSITALALLSEGQAQEALTTLEGADPSLSIVQVAQSRALLALDYPVAAESKRQAVLDNRVQLLGNIVEVFAIGLAQQN